MNCMGSFLMKGIYLIVVLITVAIVVNRIASLLSRSGELKAGSTMLGRASRILNTLVNDENCIAYKEVVDTEGKEMDLATQPVIDLEKLEEFFKSYSDVDPDCMKDFDFGYRVRVMTMPINISFYETKQIGGIFQRILELIDGKKVVFVIDVTGSMIHKDGMFCGETVCKYQCVALFLAGLELKGRRDRIEACKDVKKCMDIGFIDLMSDESEVAIFFYSASDTEWVRKIVDMTVLDGKDVRESIKEKLKKQNWHSGNTPIGEALKVAYDYAISVGADAIVLLTDGRPNVGRDPRSVVNEYKNTGIPVHTIAFGSDADTRLMEWIAQETGGEYFDARSCEELISQTSQTVYKLFESRVWEFGDKEFSKGESLKDVVKVSLPVVLKYSETVFIPAKVEIVLVKGELESFVGFVESSCLSGRDATMEIELKNPLYLSTKDGKTYACMRFNSDESCQRIACEKAIEFDGIDSPGHYIIMTKNEEGRIKVMV